MSISAERMAAIRDLIDVEDFPAADLACEQALRDHEADATVHFLRGYALGCMGDHKRAEEHCARAVELGLTDWSNYMFLGSSLRELGRKHEAHEAFAKAHRLSPTRVDAAIFYLEETLVTQGRAQAEALFAGMDQVQDPRLADFWNRLLEATHAPGDVVARYIEATPFEHRGLNLGSGTVLFEGWINIDSGYLRNQDILCDLSQGLPFVPDESIYAVYSEHFMEHIGRKPALALMTDCYRALGSGGHVRIAMPDLDDMVNNYSLGGHLAVTDTEFDDFFGGMFHTRGEWLNVAMRAWGHTYIYNYEDLERLLQAAGFIDVRRVKINASDVPFLAGRETRPAEQSSLIAEARKA